MFYNFLDVKKRQLVECILMQIFNIGISIAAIYDMFDIHELAEFRWQQVVIFYFTESCFLVCHLLFMIDYLVFMIFEYFMQISSFCFDFLANVLGGDFYLKTLKRTYMGMFCRAQYQTQTCFENALAVSASKDFCLNEYVFSVFIYLISKMINCLMELAIPNQLFKPCSRVL